MLHAISQDGTLYELRRGNAKYPSDADHPRGRYEPFWFLKVDLEEQLATTYPTAAAARQAAVAMNRGEYLQWALAVGIPG